MMKPKTIIELTIEEFAEELEILKLNGITLLKVNEHFNKRGNITYLVKNMLIDIDDDDIVVCDDEYDVIRSNRYVSFSFLKKCLISIRKIIADGVAYGELMFNDGYIRIETI